jgi:hypothetical protein
MIVTMTVTMTVSMTIDLGGVCRDLKFGTLSQ